MLQKTRGIVLRSVKYGETSLITTVFTEVYGVHGFLIQGVRSQKAKENKAGLLQPATILDIVLQYKPQQSLQRMREYQLHYIYTTLQQDVIKNSIALFSVDLLYRLLPEHAPLPELFDFVNDYFAHLDTTTQVQTANYPVFFAIQCGSILGYNIQGSFSSTTPFLSMHDGVFSSAPGADSITLYEEDVMAISNVLMTKDIGLLHQIPMSSSSRFRILNWYIDFLRSHTQHMGNLKSLAVLQAILH
jgi:DNA repair protein RecO (recombination protein O)